MFCLTASLHQMEILQVSCASSWLQFKAALMNTLTFAMDQMTMCKVMLKVANLTMDSPTPLSCKKAF